MTPLIAWSRLELRRQWRSLLVLTLLIAIASGVVMTAVAGARRGGSAVDRLLAETLPATVLVQPFATGFDWDAARALPGVERGQSRGLVASQGAVIAIVGLAIGVPLGVALGRVVWRSVAGLMFIHYVAPGPVVVLALIAPAVLVAVILLAAWPSHRAASLPVADVLRAE